MDYEEIKRTLGRLETVVKVKRAAREPHANKLTKIYRRGREDYEIIGTTQNNRTQTVVFCVANFVNVAGYILTWKTTYAHNGKRVTTQLVGFKSHAAARACAKRRLAKLNAKSYWRDVE